MLQQNWFCVRNMDMFYEDMVSQIFYDVETECIYEVTTDACDRIVILQYTDENEGYEELLKEYLVWRKLQKSVDRR